MRGTGADGDISREVIAARLANGDGAGSIDSHPRLTGGKRRAGFHLRQRFELRGGCSGRRGEAGPRQLGEGTSGKQGENGDGG